ncbi:leucyl aminopeptidase [Mangrovibacillus cuniculi]|uniref:Probable cytosol aminopeptidase n=1 Tax=Mangrovibacillus cuniculi TaxID=2593652 RepID=A0A7S8CCA7_9BACI|nr:leucyl aminopeptidase [Mangrovibacillus cuniculi]QPC47354.1 leucyl aminopeptidase [Mangrovibacillus cuniculi]
MFKVSKVQEGYFPQEGLVAGLFEKPEKFAGALQPLDEVMEGRLTNLVKLGDITAKKGSIHKVHTMELLPCPRLFFLGLGKSADVSFDTLVEQFGKLGKYLKQQKLSSISLDLRTFTTDNLTEADVAEAFAEAFYLSTYNVVVYKQKDDQGTLTIEAVEFLTSADLEEVKASLAVGSALAGGTNFARTLVNMPANILTATALAEKAVKMAKELDLEVEILEKEDLERLGMGAFLAVNQGSTEPPKMIVLKYQGKETWEDPLALVGKGITFDTGGYSIKPKDGIVGMKTDMGGAAAVLGAMKVIGELRPTQNVLAVIASTDNMISGNAFKPDDVITSMSGKTIEVLNTDAEGRLVLADAVTYAKQHGANALVDVATLTGGVIIALGNDTTGAMTNHETFFEQVVEASFEAGEFMWRLPITEKDKQRVRKSAVADLNNSPGREGHAIMAGAFIGEFAEETPWVHLDIAGTATTRAPHTLGPAGATGVMVRTLALLAEQFEPIK